LNISAQIISILSSSSKIVITTHSNPDGDAIGSSLAMYLYLKKKGHSVNVISPNEYPDFLAWLPGKEDILIYDHNQEHCDGLIAEADTIFCLDYNSLSRIGDMEKPVKLSGAYKILIDHHPNPVKEDFNHLISTIETSSTGEMIYEFISELGDKNIIDKAIAECIYVSIMTDTGSFSFACNREATYRIVADLFSLGIDGEKIHRLVYDTFSEDRLRLLGYCLSDKLVVLPEFATAYISLTRDELDRFNFKVGDTEGVVNYALSIKGVQMAVMFTEKTDKIRLSFRSKGDFAVNEIARTHFKGGGHKNAAGGDSFDTMENTIQRFINILPGYKDKLHKANL
jgi:phosphoesterase RecJ-like protein